MCNPKYFTCDTRSIIMLCKLIGVMFDKSNVLCFCNIMYLVFLYLLLDYFVIAIFEFAVSLAAFRL